MTSNGSFDAFFGSDDLERRLCISARTLQRWVAQRVIPYHRIGNKVYFRWREVVAAIGHYAAQRPPVLAEGTRYPRGQVLDVIREVLSYLSPHCLPDRLLVVGSLRRMRPCVGDGEILFVPRPAPGERVDLFAKAQPVPATTAAIDDMVARGVLALRHNVAGHAAWGAKNKYAIHVRTGIPIDLFVTTEECWWNQVVLRTGGWENNTHIAETALRRGWRWNTYGPGFTPVLPDGTRDFSREPFQVTSEQGLYGFLELPYSEPRKRR